MSFLLSVALVLGLLATLVFYLGCPNQQWYDVRTWSFGRGALMSGFISVAAWLVLRQDFSVLAATFYVLTVLMTGLAIWPLLSAHDRPVVLRSGGGVAVTKPAERGAGHLPPQWLAKIAVSLGLGFPLALSIAGLVAHGAPGALTHDTKSQFVMWMVTPIWITPLALAFFTLRARTLLLLLSIANLLAYLFLHLLRQGT